MWWRKYGVKWWPRLSYTILQIWQGKLVAELWQTSCVNRSRSCLSIPKIGQCWCHCRSSRSQCYPQYEKWTLAFFDKNRDKRQLHKKIKIMHLGLWLSQKAPLSTRAYYVEDHKSDYRLYSTAFDSESEALEGMILCKDCWKRNK